MSSLLHRLSVPWGVAPALWFLAISTPTAQAAESEVLKLTWRDSSGQCSRQRTDSLFRDHMRAVTRPTRQVHATAELSHSGSGLSIRLTSRVGGHVGRREFAAKNCQEAQAAIALLLALVAESRSLPEPPTPPPPSAPAVVAPAANVESPPAPPEAIKPSPAGQAPPVPPPAAIVWGVELQALASLGVVPEPGLGLGLRVGARWHRLEASLRAAVQTGSVSRQIGFQPTEIDATELTTTVRRAEADLQGCSYWSVASPLLLGACLHSGLHQARAHFGSAGAGASSGSVQWHGGASARAEFDWGPLQVSGEPFVGLETVQPVRGICPVDATSSGVCNQDQYVGDSVNFGLRAGVATQF